MKFLKVLFIALITIFSFGSAMAQVAVRVGPPPPPHYYHHHYHHYRHHHHYRHY